MGGTAGGVGGSAAITYVATTPLTTNLTTYSFVGASLGTVSSDRYVVVAATTEPLTGTQVNSATIAGVSATITKQDQGGGGGALTAILIAAVPTGATGTIDITYDNSCKNCSISVYTITGLASPTATATQFNRSADPNFSLVVSAGGVALCVAASVANTSCTWSPAGLTENADSFNESHTHTVASGSSAGGTTLSVVADFITNTGQDMVGAAWL
jgi:hypothetical protein